MTKKYDNQVADQLLTMGYELSKYNNMKVWQIYILGSPFGSYQEYYSFDDDDTQLMKTNLEQKRFVRKPNTLKVGKQPHYWAQHAFKETDPILVKQYTLWYNRVMTDVFGSGNTNVAESLDEHYSKLRAFVESVDKPRSFNRRKEMSINTRILPFFLSNIKPEVTSYALENDYHAGDMIVLYAQATGSFDEKDLDIISGLPEEIILALIDA